MKNIILFVILSTQFLIAQTDQFTLRVEGLGCPFCAYGLEKKFKKVKGIDQIKIDIQSGKMTYNVPAANAMKLTDADALVNKAGYTAKALVYCAAMENLNLLVMSILTLNQQKWASNK